MIILFLVEVGFFLTFAGSDFFALLRNPAVPSCKPGCTTSRGECDDAPPMPQLAPIMPVSSAIE